MMKFSWHQARPGHLPQPGRLLICDVCGKLVAEEKGSYLLRDAYALPEEPTYHVHGACVDRFQRQHEGRWDRLPLQSMEASWFL